MAIREKFSSVCHLTLREGVKKEGNPQIHCREIQNYIDGMDKLLFGSEIQSQIFLLMSVLQNLYLFTFKKNLKRYIIFSGNEDALQNF